MLGGYFILPHPVVHILVILLSRLISEPTLPTVALFLAIQTYLLVPLLPTYDRCLNTIALLGLPILNRVSHLTGAKSFYKEVAGLWWLLL